MICLRYELWSGRHITICCYSARALVHFLKTTPMKSVVRIWETEETWA